jgi:hypothetical protein
LHFAVPDEARCGSAVNHLVNRRQDAVIQFETHGNVQNPRGRDETHREEMESSQQLDRQHARAKRIRFLPERKERTCPLYSEHGQYLPFRHEMKRMQSFSNPSLALAALHLERFSQLLFVHVSVFEHEQTQWHSVVGRRVGYRRGGHLIEDDPCFLFNALR